MKPHQDWGVPNWKIETEYQCHLGQGRCLILLGNFFDETMNIGHFG